MKKILASCRFLAVLLLLGFCLPVWGQSAQKFYYYFDQKIMLSEVPGAVVATFEEGQEEYLAPALATAGLGLHKPVMHRPLHACRYQVEGQNAMNAKEMASHLESDSRIRNLLPVYRTETGEELVVTDRVMLQARQAGWETEILRRCNMLGMELVETIYMGGGTDFYVLQTPRFTNPLDLSNQLQETGLVLFAQPVLGQEGHAMFTPNDTQHGSQWFLHQSSDRDIDAREAWDITKGSSSVVVAVIDGAGFDLNHEDMVGKYTSPYDAVNNDNDPSPENQYANHGTPCAGLVGANTNNSKGVAGTGFNIKVLPIVIGYNSTSGGGFSTSSDIIARAAQRVLQTSGVVAASNSWGGGAYDAAKEQSFSSIRLNARNGKGAVVLASTGNDGQNLSQYPASYAGVIGVGNSNESDLRTPSSNYGPALEIMAPGNNTLTVDRSGSAGYGSGNYTSFGGTSAACPIAAGVVGLIASVNSNLTGVQLAEILQTTTDKVGGYNYTNQASKPLGTWNIEMGYGRINAFSAVRRAAKPTLNVTSISNGSATATWNAITGASNYSLRYKLSSSSSWTTVTVTSTTKTLTGLQSNSTYQSQVAANFSNGAQGDWSDTKTFSGSGGGGACNTPGGLNAYSITTTTGTLDWSDVSGSTGYQARIRVLGNSSWIDLGTVTGSYMNVINMTSGTTYEWQVRTLCSGGTASNYSASASFTTQQSAPYNDNPCYAYILTPYSYHNWSGGTNQGATATWSGSTCNTSSPKDVWYACQIPNSGFVTFRTSAGSLDDAMMAVYWGSCTSLNYVTCEDDNGSNTMPAIAIQGQPGTWLYIRMWGYDNDMGTFSICALNYNTGDFSGSGIPVYHLPSETEGSGPVQSEPKQSAESPELTDRDEAAIQAEARAGKIFPNPSTGIAQLALYLEKESRAQIQVLDAMGRIILEHNTALEAGDQLVELDLTGRASGTYFARIQLGETVTVQRLEIVR